MDDAILTLSDLYEMTVENLTPEMQSLIKKIKGHIYIYMLNNNERLSSWRLHEKWLTMVLSYEKNGKSDKKITNPNKSNKQT